MQQQLGKYTIDIENSKYLNAFIQRKGRFHRFYDASSLDGEIPADRERDLGAKNIDFKSSGTSVNI